MREKYSPINHRFVWTVPDNVVHEAEVAADDWNLYFPRVSSCTCVAAVLSDDTLLGAHFDKSLGANDVRDMMQRMLELRAARAVKKMWVFGNLLNGEQETRSFMSHEDFRGGRVRQSMADALEFRGDVKSFDQGALANMQYRVQSIGGGQAILYHATMPQGDFKPNGVPWITTPVD